MKSDTEDRLRKIRRTAKDKKKPEVERLKKLNIQGMESLKNEDYIVALEIYRKILDMIKSINQS